MTKVLTARVFQLVQFFVNPKTGEKLLDDDYANKLAVYLSAMMQKHSHLIKDFAIIVHDQDIYTEQEVEEHIVKLREEYAKSGNTDENGLDNYIQENQYKFVSQPKPKHIHVVITTGKTPTPISRIADILSLTNETAKIPENCIQIVKGRGGFEDACVYLTHIDERQQALGKYEYDSTKVISSFDYDLLVDNYYRSKKKYGILLTGKNELRMKVMEEGMTLRQAQMYAPLQYAEDIDKLKKLRSIYLENQVPPSVRVTFYLCGKGGCGKDTMARGLARALAGTDVKEADPFFIVGANKVSFDGYDGEPVIIWSDRRAVDLITQFGRDNFLNMFDPHPVKTIQNKKYGSVNLIHKYNIITGPESYEEFLNGLSGQYTDKNGIFHEAENKQQFYRRLPIIIPIRENDFDVLLNKGWLTNDSTLFLEYSAYKNIQGSMAKIASKLGASREGQKYINQTIAPVIEMAQPIIAKEYIIDAEDDYNEFVNYGKTPEQIINENMYTDPFDILEDCGILDEAIQNGLYEEPILDIPYDNFAAEGLPDLSKLFN